MGKQFEVYMTSYDESTLLRKMGEAGNTVVYGYFSTVELSAVTSLDPVEDMGDLKGVLCIFCPAIKPKLAVKELPNDRRSLDSTRSDVIEFSRCVLRKDGTLAPGRFWYEHQTTSGKPKRKIFLEWASEAFRTLKKMYVRSKEENNRYFAPDAWEKHQVNELRLAPY